MAAQLNHDPLSRVCSYCRTGIQASALFAECTYCRLPYCISCRFEHQASHQIAIVTVRSVIHQFEVNGENEVCSICSKLLYFSYACCECEYALCRSCWFEQDIDMHQHKTFNVIELPRLVKSKAGVAVACCAVPAVSHCSTCAAPFSLGQDMILCKTCYLRTNERVYFCVRCYISSEESHPRHHESWQWTVEIAMPGELAPGIHCNECLHVIRSVENLKAHPHTSYVDVYTERDLEQIIARSYRQCQKKAARVDNMLAAGSDRCTMCLQKTVSSSILPCRQCNEINRLCAHCEQHASKLHIHKLPTSDSSGSARPSGTTATQNIPVDTPPKSSILLQAPQSPVYARISSNPVPGPVPSPIPSTISNASHRLPSLPPYHAIKPPWDRSYNENEPYIIYEPCEYPLKQGQEGTYLRYFFDPAVALPRSRTSSGSPRPYPTAPLHSRSVQDPQHVQPRKSSQLASPPSSPQPNLTESPYKAPPQPSRPRQAPQPASPTPPISPQPDSHRLSSSRPGKSPQPRQSSHPASTSPQTSHQLNPTRPSRNKPAQPAYPSPSPQPAHPSQSPQHTYPSQSPQHTYPSQSPQPAHPSQISQPIYPSQSPQPSYPSEIRQPAYSTPPTSHQQNLTGAFSSKPTQPSHPTQHPQLSAPTTPDTLSTPPVQRLSSAPQILISTAEHPQEEAIPQQRRTKLTGFKKAYDVTQKNAATRFVTRVAAKTAFSAVSNVIGADIGGVVDAAGGLNLGGTGIDGGGLVSRVVTSAADAAFDEALGDDGHASHGGGRRKILKSNVLGHHGVRFGGGGGVK